MSETAPLQNRQELGDVARRGLYTVGLSVAANAVVLAVATELLGVAPNFESLDWPPVIFLTVVGAVGATVVYAGLTRVVARPDRTFTLLAGVVLLVSFLPDLLWLPDDPGATTAGIVVLMLMHVVVAAICVAVLTQ